MVRFFAMFMCLLLSALSMGSVAAFADHPPEKLFRNFKAFGQLGETGQLGPFTVNVARFGNLPDGPVTSGPNSDFTGFLDDKFNLASIVMKEGAIIHEAYNGTRKIDSNTPLLGMSMSKTAVAAAVGSLICAGKIAKIDDRAGAYSGSLAETVFADVTIRNLLQMNSGVSPLGRGDEKIFNWKARGVNKFHGQASVRATHCVCINPHQDRRARQ